MVPRIRVGVVLLPELRWAEAREHWRAVEDMGFAAAWTYDHLAWRDLVDEPWFATVPTLTAAATVTRRIRLGTWVASPNYRHPVPFAKELMTVDDVSDGRLIVGIGAGGTGWDADVLGEPRPTPAQRVRRFDEFCELLDQLLRQPSTTRHGEWFSAVAARMVPGPVQRPRPPFVLAANGPRALRVAATRGDAWATTGIGRADEGPDAWWRDLADLVTRFEDTLVQVGRRPADVDRYLSLDAGPVYSLTSREAFADAAGRAAELGFTDVVTHWPRTEGVYAGDRHVLEQVAADLGRVGG